MGNINKFLDESRKSCDSKNGKIRRNYSRRVGIEIELCKQLIGSIIDKEKDVNGKNSFEILMKDPKKILKKIADINGEFLFDMTILYTLLATIKKKGINRKTKTYSINLHIDTLLNPLLINYIREIKKDLGIFDLSFLHVEILEFKGRKKIDFDKLKDVVKKLQKEGIEVGIDDFPTGENIEENVSKLRKKLKEIKTDLDFIKIDKSLVFNGNKNIVNDEEMFNKLKEMVGTLVDSNNNLVIVVEGVENKEIWEKLKNIKGINLIQGYGVIKGRNKRNNLGGRKTLLKQRT